MAEEKTADAQELNEDGTPIKPDDGGEGGDQPLKKTNNDTKEGTDEDSDDDEEDNSDSDLGDDTDEPEIPVRRSAASHIIKRKNETIKKLRRKDDVDDDSNKPSDELDEDDDDFEEKQTEGDVAKEVKKQIDPIVKNFASQADEEELKDLLSSEPTSKKYEKRIRAYMKHPSWSQVPPMAIYQHLAFGDAQAIGAHKKKVADTEAGHTKSGGRSVRPRNTKTGNVPSVEELDNMDDEAFEKVQHEARTGKFLSKDQ